MKKFTFMFFMSVFSIFSAFSQGLPMEGFETWPPSGWGIYDNGVGLNQSWKQTLPGDTVLPAYAGSFAARLDRENVPTGTPQDWLVTPQFIMPANAQLRFYTRLFSPGIQGSIYRIMISTSSNPADLSAYTPVVQWTENELNPSQIDYIEKLVDIPGTAGTQVYVAFVMEATNRDGWLIDNVSIAEKCLAPTALGATNVGATTAQLTWTAGNATEWEIELMESTDTPTGIGEAYDGTLPYPANNLEENTSYKYYVRSVCSNTNKSVWAGPFTFTTARIGSTCAQPLVVPSLPFSTTSNTSLYGDHFDGTPGATSCGSTAGYLNGDDVVYSFTPTVTGNISIDVTNNGTWTGLFVYDDCADIGTACIAGAVSGSTSNPVSVPTLAVTAGTTYYVVISTYAAPQSTPYTLTIQEFNCAKPTALTTSNIAPTSANLSWVNATSTSWEVAVQAAGAGIPAGAGVTTLVNTNYNVTQTLSGTVLAPSTAYEYYVRASCGNGTFSAWAGPVAFTTTQIPAGMDYTQDFEGTTGWTLNNGTQTNKWVVGTAINNGGTHSLYVSNDNGVTNAYTNNTASVVQAYRDIQMPTYAHGLNLSFDWRAAGESTYDYIRVWVVPTTFNPVPGTQIAAAAGRQQIGGNLNQNAAFTTANYIIPGATFSGQTMRLVFEWRNDGSGGVNPPAAIDNINLEVITCPDPSNPTVSGITQTSAVLGWTAPTGATPTYDYYLSTSATPPVDATVPTDNVSTTSATVTVVPGTTYYYWVRSNCGDVNGNGHWIGPKSFHSLQIPAPLDYTQDFEGTAGWTLNNDTQTNKWVVGTAVNNGGANSLYVTNDNGVTNAYSHTVSVVQAYRDIQMPTLVDELNLSFDWRAVGESTYDYVRVWAVPASYFPTPGTQITAGAGRIQIGGNHNQSGTFTTSEYIVPATAFAGQVMRLVFEWRNDGGGGANPPAAIDNINLSFISCAAPSNLTVSGITLHEANIAWTGPTSADPTYDYYLSTSATPPTDTTAPTDNVDALTEPLTGLDSGTYYNVWVRSNCGNGNNSYWVGPLQFHTLCDPFNVPFYEGFNSTSATEMCWTVTNGNADTDAWDMNYTPTPFEGNQSAMMYTDGNAGNNNDWLISPTIILTGNQRLKFHYRIQSASEPNNFEVLLSTTGTAPAAFTNTIIASASYNNTTYIESVTDISAYSGPVNIAWHVPQGGLDGWRIYIDNVIIEDLPPCPEITNLEASCIGAQSANFNWTAGSTETSWEIAIALQTDPVPTTGIVVEDVPLYYAQDLTPETDYTFYVRTICPSGELGPWKKVNFTTPETSLLDAAPFCASENPDAAILFDNVYDDMDVEGYGQVACLGSTPNPVWYYLQVENAGDLDFELIQNTQFTNGLPTGQGLDVDFVAFGPFNSMNEACGQIELVDCPTCPNNTNNPNFYPFGNIVDCSYDPDDIEHFTIDNAQAGEFYAVLITNYNGDQGQIKLQQLASSTGSTNCNLLYNVDLGADQILCGVEQTNITATVTTPGNSEAPAYEWKKDGVTFTPTVVSTTPLTQTIAVTESGTYSVVITVDNSSNTDPITDEVIIALGPEVVATEPALYEVCDDASNDGVAVFDLTTLNSEVLGTLDADDFTVEYFVTEAEATAGTPAIANPAQYTNTSNGQTLYVRVTSTAVSQCFDVAPVTIGVKPSPETTIDLSYEICEDGTAVITAVPVNYAEADASLVWYKDGGLIEGENTLTLITTEEGIYTLEVTVDGCTSEVDTEVIIIPAPDFNLGGPYVVCDAASAVIQVNAENFNPADATYAWTYEGATVGGNTSSLTGVGYGNYEVTVTIGDCSATSSVAITQDTTPLAFNLGGPYVVCNPELAVIQVTTESFDLADATYTWTFNGEPVAGNTSTLPGIDFGTYAVTVAIGDCTATQSVAITENTESFEVTFEEGCDNNIFMVHVAPVEDAEGNLSFDPETSEISWTGPEGFTSSEFSSAVTAIGVYTVTVTTAEGCVSVVSIPIETTSCLIPRGISPNNDGMNDNFDLSGFNVAKLSIFNRYGREVYSKTNYTNEWFGQTDGGDELPTGTYFFSMERANGESRTGWVYINRQEN